MMQWRHCVTAAAGVCLVAGCQQPDERQPEATKAAAAAPVLPVAQPVLDREALLMAVMHAASGAALGKDDAEWQRKLDGQRFALRMRFGCNGASHDAKQPRGWRFDKERRVLSLHVEADIAKDAPLIRSLALSGYEAVEGFWIHRPWLLRADCPVVPARGEATAVASGKATDAPAADKAKPSPAPAALPPPQIGIAQFFTPTDARTHRRDDRAYEATKVLGEGELPSATGYDLVISGRLRQLVDGRVIACTVDSTTAPPRCIISAQLDGVSIELPGSGKAIANWLSG
jgi:hypothetical protein